MGAYSSIKTCENLGDKLNLHFVMKAAKPKLMSEKVQLCSPTDPTVHLEIVLLARVLGMCNFVQRTKQFPNLEFVQNVQ